MLFAPPLFTPLFLAPITPKNYLFDESLFLLRGGVLNRRGWYVVAFITTIVQFSAHLVPRVWNCACWISG